MPTDDGGAGNTEAGGRRPKASKERNRGKWHAVAPGALWRFERGRGGASWRPMPLNAWVDDVTAHEQAAVRVSIHL
jgi:hypothetical protein